MVGGEGFGLETAGFQLSIVVWAPGKKEMGWWVSSSCMFYRRALEQLLSEYCRKALCFLTEIMLISCAI